MKQVKSSDDGAPLTRREKARATRLAIIHAAQEEFVANGYHATTMSAIAARAGVAVQTVHFVFHTKGELLGAVVDNAVLGEEPPTPPEQTDWYRAVLEEQDPIEALRRFVLAGKGIFVRASAMNEVARSAAGTDPDARATFERVERLREAGYRNFLAHLATRCSFRDDLGLDGALDVLLSLLSPRMFLSLTQDRGWDADRAMAWIADTVPGLILAR
ncbi:MULTISPECIES: TetR/AcrR family transcriptional regulator [Arthrobacter]|uniref:Helix-turn-helix domain-containing protein n=2 Tax=Arthrobacter TaxID=1663 RepID=A0ABU9KMP3_9MICC|nr:TetR/AcrR family transcriptional regulator [Arthrobacter sp. YJM1]MDP5228217.1 helix-turn-helix domain-containing protein [Arthrobacter sp. YJM1]